VRTLPLRLAPIDGESLPGYIARYSHTFHFRLGDLLCALGLSHSASDHAIGCDGVALSGDQLARVAIVTSIPAARVERMLLASYAGRAFPSSSLAGPLKLNRERHTWEVMFWRSRFCPRCLREDGAWLLRWQLGWSVACVRHHELLHHRCPRCGERPRVGPRQISPQDRRGQVSDPRCCVNTHERQICHAPFTATASVSLANKPELVEAQRRIDAVLDGEQEPTLAGQPLDPPTYLRDLRLLGNLLNSRTHFVASPRSSRFRRLLDDPQTAAGVLPRVIELADLPHEGSLADALRDFVDDRYRQTGKTIQPTALGEVSPPLSAALRHAVSHAVYASASSKMGFAPRAHRRPSDLDDALEARHVPQLFWALDYERELSELFALADCSPRTGRRFCSVLLARMLTPLSWTASVRYLDLPEQFVNEGYNTIFVKLRTAGCCDELARRIKQIANDHARRGLVDHKQRRANLAQWTGIDPQTWRLLQPRPYPPSLRWDRPRRRAYASIWLWCQLTSGHEQAAPLATPRPELQHHDAFRRSVIPRIREPLLLLGEILLATPPLAMDTVANRFAVARYRQGALPNSYRLPHINPPTQERILAHASAHTGIDIATITAPPCGVPRPPAVANARLLTAALLHEVALTHTAVIASILKASAGRLGDNTRAYRATIAKTPTLAAEFKQLTRQIEDLSKPAPTPPTLPHQQRMLAIAAAIKSRAIDLLQDPHGTELALRASMTVCQTHTDLPWPEITALHDRPTARRANTHNSAAHHARTSPAFNDRYKQLLEHARALQLAAGYTNLNLAAGLAARA
jgi:hypothetical protein